MSLLVCNMLIVVTSFYRLIRSEVPTAQIGANHRALAAADTLSSGRTTTQDAQTDTGYTVSRIWAEDTTEYTSGIPSTEPLELTQIFESDLSAHSYPVSESLAMNTKITT